jgi:hypothetical protein
VPYALDFSEALATVPAVCEPDFCRRLLVIAEDAACRKFAEHRKFNAEKE